MQTWLIIMLLILGLVAMSISVFIIFKKTMNTKSVLFTGIVLLILIIAAAFFHGFSTKF
ncbi:hypothetical protein Lspi_2062 [Legionella spiritensis]|uniref:Transmembrane protein n=1 Tax=Legionella spiritensis TaxID=452 RepID=A0A0W0YZ84_LEGSP|nr:hypothetical protein Lspi_2062 [Legionella spiritensis]SNV29178.1 Uncharacterised protein [Legionella spiritensis]